MPSHREQFFERARFAVVGDSARKPFPTLTYGGLKSMGKQVFPVDLGGRATIDGDAAFASLAELPASVEAVVVEVPPDETMAVAEQVATAGVKDLWLHMKCDTPEVLSYCKDHGIDTRHGTCAVMYTRAGSYHRIHRGLMKLLRKY